MGYYSDNFLTEIPFDLPGKVYRSPMPFSRNDPRGSCFLGYQEAGVTVIVLLVPDQDCLVGTGRDLRSFYRQENMKVIHLPIEDFGAPALPDLRQAVETAIQHLEEGHHLAVHCYAGIGRTGLFLACLARRLLNLEAPEAIEWVRRYVPGAVERPAQVQLVQEFS